MEWNETPRILWLHQSEAASGREGGEGGRGKLKEMGKGGLATFDKLLLAALTTSTWFIIHYKPTHKRRVCVCALVHVHLCV